MPYSLKIIINIYKSLYSTCLIVEAQGFITIKIQNKSIKKGIMISVLISLNCKSDLKIACEL